MQLTNVHDMMTASALESVRGAYEARNYQAVVQALAAQPREVLLQSPEQAYMLADAARRVGGYDDFPGLLSDVVEAAREARIVQDIGEERTHDDASAVLQPEP